MINIIRSDLFRLRKSILWIIVVALIPILLMTPGLYTMSILSYSSSDLQLEAVNDAVTEYCEEKGIESYDMTTQERRDVVLGIEGYKPDLSSISGNYFYVFLAALIFEILIVTRDLSCHSVKNTLTAPVSRKTYYLSKLATLFLVTLIFDFLLNLYTWIVNLILNGSSHSMPFGDFLLGSVKHILPIMMFITIFNVLAFLIQKSLPFILAAFGIYLFLSTMLISILLIINIIPYFIAYLPETIYGTLMFPDDPDYLQYFIESMVVCVTVIPVSAAAGYLIFRKMEIK